MRPKLILTALASATILCGGQALAQHGGGPGGGGGGAGGPHGGPGGGFGNSGGFGAGGPGGMGNPGGMDGFGASMRDQARVNSEGPANASATGIAHANENSVLAGTTGSNRVASGALAGVSTGMPVYSNGALVGSVQQIRMAGNGSVALVLVKGANGGIYPVPASKLSLNRGTLSTTARFNGINDSRTAARMNSEGPAHASATGIAHANQHSVLYNGSAAVASNNEARLNSQGRAHASATGISHANRHSVLAAGSSTMRSGVSVGMPLLKNGTQVGTVYRVVTANGAIRRVLVQGTNGRIYSLAPSALIQSGGSLMTTATLRGM